MLRRLKYNGAAITDLLDVYIKQVRCTLEFAVSVWTAAITAALVAQIERVQITAVILGGNHSEYSQALSILNIETLVERRKKLCVTFASKCEKSEKYKHWFTKRTCDPHAPHTRSEKIGTKSEFLSVHSRTRQFEKSPLSYLTSLLNEGRK